MSAPLERFAPLPPSLWPARNHYKAQNRVVENKGAILPICRRLRKGAQKMMGKKKSKRSAIVAGPLVKTWRNSYEFRVRRILTNSATWMLYRVGLKPSQDSLELIDVNWFHQACIKTRFDR